MEKKGVILKQGRERPLIARHPWIFSGAIKSYPEPFVNGEIYPVFSAENELMGYGYFNRKNSLSGRMLTFENRDPMEAVKAHLIEAISLRRSLFDNNTTAYRLVNAEGDFLPGLIVDYYNEYLVMQIGTLGMDRLKNALVGLLEEMLPIKGIYEKSESASRSEEGLKPSLQILSGEIPKEIVIEEEGLRFIVSILEGQKTGFFIDQREMRKLVGQFSKNRRVLNGFSYSGGFSLQAMKGGALFVDTVDYSASAIVLARRNWLLNGFKEEMGAFFAEDLFRFFETREKNYDLIILDPPAFAKQREETLAALKGYTEINRLAMNRLSKGGLLLTASCSYHVDEMLFQKAIMKAALKANREVKILSRHRLAFDHPQSLFHPEGSYLKSLLVEVR